jgi:hypothetical protein
LTHRRIPFRNNAAHDKRPADRKRLREEFAR